MNMRKLFLHKPLLLYNIFMSVKNDFTALFHFLSDLFFEKKIQAIVIGGYAVNQHNVSRQTADIDFLIASGDFGKIYSSLEKIGYTILYQQDFFVQLAVAGSGIDLDFMLVDQETLQKMYFRCIKTLVSGCNFSFPCLNDLLALKLHSVRHNPLRVTKDLPDIVNLLRANNIMPEDEEFQKLCLKFGTPDLCRRIREDFYGY